ERGTPEGRAGQAEGRQDQEVIGSEGLQKSRQVDNQRYSARDVGEAPQVARCPVGSRGGLPFPGVRLPGFETSFAVLLAFLVPLLWCALDCDVGGPVVRSSFY